MYENVNTVNFTITIAVLIGLSHIAVTANDPGDVISGACIGILAALQTQKFFKNGAENHQQRR